MVPLPTQSPSLCQQAVCPALQGSSLGALGTHVTKPPSPVALPHACPSMSLPGLQAPPSLGLFLSPLHPFSTLECGAPHGSTLAPHLSPPAPAW